MKIKSILIFAIVMLVSFVANTQTLKWTNDVNNDYEVRINYTLGGNPFSTIHDVWACSQGSWTCPAGGTINSFSVYPVSCSSPTVDFTWGSAPDVQDIEECNTCVSTEAEIGYINIPNTFPTPDDGWFGIKCKDI